MPIFLRVIIVFLSQIYLLFLVLLQIPCVASKTERRESIKLNKRNVIYEKVKQIYK